MIRREPMRRADRAKQFMPFAALTGLEEALQKKDRAYEDAILHEYEHILDPECPDISVTAFARAEAEPDIFWEE